MLLSIFFIEIEIAVLLVKILEIHPAGSDNN